MIRQYARFLKQLRSVRRAMADYFAGQQFFDFYADERDLDECIPARPTGSSGEKRGRTHSP
jgi:hypothetical protein